jgi:hypothetical protein
MALTHWIFYSMLPIALGMVIIYIRNDGNTNLFNNNLINNFKNREVIKKDIKKDIKEDIYLEILFTCSTNYFDKCDKCDKCDNYIELIRREECCFTTKYTILNNTCTFEQFNTIYPLIITNYYKIKENSEIYPDTICKFTNNLCLYVGNILNYDEEFVYNYYKY